MLLFLIWKFLKINKQKINALKEKWTKKVSREEIYLPYEKFTSFTANQEMQSQKISILYLSTDKDENRMKKVKSHSLLVIVIIKVHIFEKQFGEIHKYSCWSIFKKSVLQTAKIYYVAFYLLLPAGCL